MKTGNIQPGGEFGRVACGLLYCGDKRIAGKLHNPLRALGPDSRPAVVLREIYWLSFEWQLICEVYENTSLSRGRVDGEERAFGEG
jgi:hypothetical protein